MRLERAIHPIWLGRSVYVISNPPQLLAGASISGRPVAPDIDALYEFIKDEVCLDGYLTNEFPKTPPIIGAFCIGSLYLIGVENCQPGAGPMVDEFNPFGTYSAGMPDAIGVWLHAGFSESRIRESIRDEVVPWCLGDGDPLAEATEQIGESERLRFRRISR